MEELATGEELDAATIMSLDDAVSELQRNEPHLAEVARLGFYPGLSVDETARCWGCRPAR